LKKTKHKHRPLDRWEDDAQELKDHIAFAKNAIPWLSVRNFENTTDLIAAVRADNRAIWVTDLSQHAESLFAESTQVMPQKVAICMGSELAGASPELLKAADKRVYLPLHGFADSLNLSVAAAMVMQRMFMIDTSLVGAMEEQERCQLRLKWYPAMARNDVQREAFTQCAIEANKGIDAIMPFADMRRPEDHRKHLCANLCDCHSTNIPAPPAVSTCEASAAQNRATAH